MICSEVIAHCLEDKFLKQLQFPPAGTTPAGLEKYLKTSLGQEPINLKGGNQSATEPREKKTNNKNLLTLKRASLGNPYASAYASAPVYRSAYQSAKPKSCLSA